MDLPFRYEPCCTFPGCQAVARAKIAAAWSDGSYQELKTYALACPEHLDGLRAAAIERRERVRLAEGEILEPIAVYPLPDRNPGPTAPPGSP